MTGAGMTERLFLQILNMSFGGSIAILLVLLCRALLARAPKHFSYALWALPLFRLLCPFSFESAKSPLPVTAEPIPMDIGMATTPQIHTGLPMLNAAVNESLPAATPQYSANPLQIWIAVGTLVWLAGVLVMAVYALVSFLRLRRRLTGAVLLEGNVYVADHIPSPFVLGLFRPRIYLPSSLAEEERAHVIAHERAHLRRFDHVTRLLGFAALCLHWFNPLVYLAVRLSARDMELSCDERVLRGAAGDIRTAYAGALLRLSAAGQRLPGAPLAFGESDAKVRIKNVLRYQKPTFWISVAAVALCLAAAVCALVSRTPEAAGAMQPAAGIYRVSDILYDAPMYSFSYGSPENAPMYRIGEDRSLYETNGLSSGDGWTRLGLLEETALGADALEALFVPGWPEGFSAKAIAEGVLRAWQLAPAAKGETFVLVLQEQSGDLLLLYGHSLQDGGADAAHARWLFRLAPQPAVDTGSLNETIGSDLGRPVRCFSLYEDAGAPGYLLAGWIAGDDMGYSTLYRANADAAYQLVGSYVGAGWAATVNTLHLAGPILGDGGSKVPLDVFFCNDPQLAGITRTVDDVSETQTVSGAPSMTVFHTPDDPDAAVEVTANYLPLTGEIDASAPDVPAVPAAALAPAPGAPSRQRSRHHRG